MMEQIGFQDLVEAEDDAVACEKLTQLSPSPGLIIADYHMPGLDGLELLCAARSGQIENIPHDIPFIMITGEGKLESFIAAIQLDVDAFLDKPTTRPRLEEKIRSLFGQQKTERTIKEPAYYLDMDVESAKELFANIETVVSLEGVEEKEVRVTHVIPGAILTRDLMHSTGHVLLAASTRMNEEILILLQKISVLSGGMENLWVRI